MKRPFDLLPALVLVAGSAAAEDFGLGCPGPSGVTPGLDSDSPAVAAPGWEVRLSGPPDLAGVLLVGVSDTVGLGLPLPLDLGLLSPGLSGCELLVSGELLVPYATDGAGLTALTFDASALPPDASLFLQAWSLDFDLASVPPRFGGWSAGRAATFVAPSGVGPGDVVITEFLADPSFTSDATGEWLEVENLTARPLDLRGWTLRDDDGDLVTLGGDAPLLLGGFGRLVLGASDDQAANGGLPVDGTFTDGVGEFRLGNGADEIVLATYDGVDVDRVAYDGGVLWPAPTGASLALAPDQLDADANDDPANWGPSSCFLGGAPFNTDRGTPGLDNADCPTPELGTGTGELLVTELMANPAAVGDAVGEYFELANVGGASVLLDGWTVCTASVCETLVGGVVLAPGARLVCAVEGDPALNGGLPPGSYGLLGGLFLPNSGGSIQVLRPDGTLVALLPYGASSGLPVLPGTALELKPSTVGAAQAQDPSNWCPASTPFGQGDLGSPGAPNSGCR